MVTMVSVLYSLLFIIEFNSAYAKDFLVSSRKRLIENSGLSKEIVCVSVMEISFQI